MTITTAIAGRHGSRSPRIPGFTLIELLIVVLILAILTMIAVPSYERYVVNAKLTQAKSNLTLLSTLMERYYQDHNAYPPVTPNVGTLTPPLQGWSPGSNAFFTYAITSSTASGYGLSATAIPGHGVDGYVFTLDSSNNQTETLPGSTTPVSPWQS